MIAHLRAAVGITAAVWVTMGVGAPAQAPAAAAPAKESERVSGTLDGRHGTFILQHHAMMTRGRPDLNINVVPDSGTGELTGFTGRMGIRIENGQHFYDFDYSLGEAQ